MSQFIRKIWRFLKQKARDFRFFIYPKTVILLYHRIANVSDDPHKLSVTPENFRSHLAILAKNGYKFISMSECIQGTKFKTRTAVVTFDDGYADNLYNALPILESLKIPATIFVVSGKITERNMVQMPFYWDEETEAKDRGIPLTKEELIKLASHPLIEIGAHTITHPRLSELSIEMQKEEIENSKKDLEAVIGKSVIGFAYPFGGADKDFTRETMDIVRSAGFKYACSTTKAGFAQSSAASRGDTMFSIPRLNIRNQSPEMILEKCLQLS